MPSPVPRSGAGSPHCWGTDWWCEAGGRKRGGVRLWSCWKVLALGGGGSVLFSLLLGWFHPPSWPSPTNCAKECAWERRPEAGGQQSYGHPEALHRSGAEGQGARGQRPQMSRGTSVLGEEPGIPLIPCPGIGPLQEFWVLSLHTGQGLLVVVGGLGPLH